MEPRNRFQGMNSASLCSLAGRYDNHIPTRFLAPSYYRLFKNSSSVCFVQAFTLYEFFQVYPTPSPTEGNTEEENNGHVVFKGTVSRDFLLLVFFMNQFPPSPRVSQWDRFKFFRKFAEIVACKGAPPVSTTPVTNLPPVSTTPAANFVTSLASVVDTGGK
jgi:hypothetical protein